VELQSFFSKMFYGNTVLDWVVAFSGVLLSILLAKVVYRIVKRLASRFTKKTKTRVDDLLFDVLEEPLSLALAIYGASFSLNSLNLIGRLDSFINNTIYFAFVLTAGWFVDRLVQCLFKEVIAPFVAKTENDVDDQLLPMARRGTRAIVWAVAIIVGINNAGYDVGALLAGLGIGGLAFALAAQDTVQNLFGGVTIFLDKPFKLNDRVKLGDLDGIIEEIGPRSTRIRTLAGRMVTIPNSKFTDQPVENISSEEARKVSLQIGLTYDMTHEQVKEAMDLLNQIALDQEGVKDESVSYFEGFGDFSLNIGLIYYIEKGADIFGVMTATNLNVLKKFSENGLEMAFPTQTLHHIGQKSQDLRQLAS
jgi:MscS family membrane protein